MKYDGFRLNPEWEPVATERDPLKMANALYTDLKKHVYQGILFSKETIQEMINVVKFVLEKDFFWDVEQTEEFEEYFKNLNQYYSPENKINEFIEDIKSKTGDLKTHPDLNGIISRLVKEGATIEIGALDSNDKFKDYDSLNRILSSRQEVISESDSNDKPNKYEILSKTKKIVINFLIGLLVTLIIWMLMSSLLILLGV
jgi:hypothetical protein